VVVVGSGGYELGACQRSTTRQGPGSVAPFCLLRTANLGKVPPVTRRRLAMTSTLLLVLAVAASVWWLVPSWVSLPRRELPTWTQRFALATHTHADVAPGSSLLHIGHRAGSYEEYAKNLAGDLDHARPVTELMDLSFGELGLNVIELDVRSSPIEGDEHAVVVHDRIAPGALTVDAREYIRQNTFEALVRHYVSQGYHRQGKRLFVELKAAEASGVDPEGRSAIERVAAALTRVLKGRADAARVRSHIELISFNRFALAHARETLGAEHCLHLILTSNRHPGFALELVRPDLRALDEGVTAWLAKTPLLSGVFFDPRYVEGFAALFNGINRRRGERGLSPLAVHLSTYSHDYAGFVERLAGAGQRLRNVRGLIYEVRKGE
jgi:hypothetical protein